MKAWNALSVAASVLLSSAAAVAQDPVKVDPTHYKPLFENASVRILQIDYAPGSKSVMHNHPDAIVIPLTPSKVRFTLPDGKSEDVDMPSEAATYSPAGTHSPSNIGTARVRGILVEFKTAAPGKATLPASREGLTIKVLAEGPRAMAYRTTATPTFAEASGSKHEFDQVVIALGPTPISLSIDGKPARATWVRGDVQFIGRGVPHESKNTGGKPVDMIIVAIR